MPARDGTGPRGQGAMTGWGMGPCGAGYRRGPARGFGRGPMRGPGRGYAYQSTKEQEMADLKAEKGAVEQELQEIKERLRELESEK